METRLGSAWYASAAADLAHKGLDVGDELRGFVCIGAGTSRIALLGPDAVVYKIEQPYRHRQTKDELAFFRYVCQRGYSWAPDFWYYQDFNIMAMPEYRTVRGITADLEISQPELLEEINIFTVDWGDHNFGVRDDGSVVLIDGGRSTVPVL